MTTMLDTCLCVMTWLIESACFPFACASRWFCWWCSCFTFIIRIIRFLAEEKRSIRMKKSKCKKKSSVTANNTKINDVTYQGIHKCHTMPSSYETHLLELVFRRKSAVITTHTAATRTMTSISGVFLRMLKNFKIKNFQTPG